MVFRLPCCVDGKLPWRLPGDLAYFKQLTTSGSTTRGKNVVLMGRKTWESIPQQYRPLPGRINIVLSRKGGTFDGADGVAASLEDAMGLVDRLQHPVGHVFVIGGGEIYKEAMVSDRLSAIHLTRVESDVDCDTFFPPVDSAKFQLWVSSSPRRDTPDGARYSFMCYTRIGNDGDGISEEAVATLPKLVREKHEEYQYLNMIQEAIDSGVYRGDRTGTGTYSMFGRTMRFNLRDTFPLLTTKRVFWRGMSNLHIPCGKCDTLSVYYLLLCRSGRRIAMVYQRKHQCQGTVRQRYSHLGW